MKSLKLAIDRLKSPWTPLVILLGLGTTAWSPPAGDNYVNVGTANTTTGYIGTVSGEPTKPVNITAFKGIISGTGNYAGSGAGYSALFGEGNYVNAYSSVVAGIANEVALTATAASTSSMVKYSGVFGSKNAIANGASSNVVGGYSNSVNSNSSIVGGSINTIEGATAGGTPGNWSAAFGLSNHVMAYEGWCMGRSNTVSAQGGIAVGQGTVADKPAGTALGKWNVGMADGDVLVVGAGTADTARSTALRITSDGSVILGRAQGDISMGAYSN